MHVNDSPPAVCDDPRRRSKGTIIAVAAARYQDIQYVRTEPVRRHLAAERSPQAGSPGPTGKRSPADAHWLCLAQVAPRPGHRLGLFGAPRRRPTRTSNPQWRTPNRTGRRPPERAFFSCATRVFRPPRRKLGLFGALARATSGFFATVGHRRTPGFLRIVLVGRALHFAGHQKRPSLMG